VRLPGSARVLRPGVARWLRYATVVVVTAGSAMLVSPAAPAWACSCVQPTPQQAAAVAGLVFAGVVRDLDRPAAAGSGDPVVVTFAVSEVYKGEVSATMRVSTPADGAVCGYQFVEGNRYLVHARIEEQQRRLDGETTPAGPSMRESGQRNVASVIVARKNSPAAHSSVPKK
jgi:hypothetical protein